MPNFINEMMLAEVKTLVEASPSLIVLDPAKLNSAQTLKLRSDLRAAGAKLKVAKVAILQRCVPDGAKAMLDNKSTIALVLANDMLGAAKVVAELAKEEKITLKGGMMDGKVVDTASIKRLAELPDQLTLRGMLVNILAAPLTGMARVIAEIHKKKAGDAPAV